MTKAALVVLADTAASDGLGRVVNAMITAKELKESGDARSPCSSTALARSGWPR
jgi:hypothetical protein